MKIISELFYVGGSELLDVGEWGVVTAPIFSQIDELLMNDLHKFDTKTRRVFVFFLAKI